MPTLGDVCGLLRSCRSCGSGGVWMPDVQRLSHFSGSCLAAVAVDYPLKSMASQGLIKSASQISSLALLMNVLVIIPTGLAARITTEGDELGLDGFMVGCRFAVALPMVNTRIMAAPQLLASALAISRRCNPFFVFREICVATSLIALSSFLETCISSQIEAHFESAEAGSMLTAFRRLLRGVCDGEVLLDSQMRIQGEPQCLKHMLMISTALHGKSFENFLGEDEKRNFAQLIASSGDESKEASLPLCVRACLRGANDVKVRVDMFHVQVPQYWGAGDRYHLVALREDSETQVPDAIPTELPDFSRKRGPSSRSHGSNHSQASASSGGLPSGDQLAGLLSEGLGHPAAPALREVPWGL
ncbi:unnamed protein product [Effrenium voratum]|uniref:Uncharacterized protein n=1 Tax=Effrenium voratum TaxID=2562239 RepID=A0AA36JFY1_9DINO|nr:unnamed protein product [Effrenium voratum]CAJ1437251.1 unnamed protein product [Effrenium voratum]